MYIPKLGVSINLLIDKVNSSILEQAITSNIDFVEVTASALNEREIRNSWINLLTEWSEKTLMRVASVHADFGTEYDISSPDLDIRVKGLESIEEAFQLASKLDAYIVVVHPSGEPILPSERVIRKNIAKESMRLIETFSHRYEIRAAFEYLPRTCLGNTIEELLELIGEFDKNAFGICLDTNHLMDRYEDLGHFVRKLGERLLALHVSDYDGKDEQHKLPGTGIVDWNGFLQALSNIDYKGSFNYECNLPGKTSSERLAALESNFKWLLTSWAKYNEGKE